VEVLFYLAKLSLQKMPFDQDQRLKTIAQMAFRCISEYANIRSSYFSDKNTKNQFIVNFVKELVNLFSNSDSKPVCICIFSNVSILREVLKIVFKFHDNFGVRGLINCEIEQVLDQYLACIYQFTI
jgi:hypothetical protein